LAIWQHLGRFLAINK